MKKTFVVMGLLLMTGCTQTNNINSFEECVAAGNPVLESYPRQCTADGQTFTEELELCGSMSIEQAIITAQDSECVTEGNLTSNYVCNENTNTVWIDLIIEDLEGCNPACVVNTETSEVEINYRCTGLIIE